MGRPDARSVNVRIAVAIVGWNERVAFVQDHDHDEAVRTNKRVTLAAR